MGDCYNEIEINSPITEVWKTISNFHDMSWAGNVIINVSKVGDKEGTQIGARRVLNGIIYETLNNFDPDEFTFSYSIDQGEGPISSILLQLKAGHSWNGVQVLNLKTTMILQAFLILYILQCLKLSKRHFLDFSPAPIDLFRLNILGNLCGT